MWWNLSQSCSSCPRCKLPLSGVSMLLPSRFVKKKPTVEDLQPLTLSSQVIQDLKQMTDSCRVNSLTLHPNAYFTSAHRVLPSHLITKVQYSMRHQLLLQTYPIIDLLCLLYKLYHRYVWIGKAHTAFGTIHVQAATGRLGPHPLWRRGDNYTKQGRWTLLRKWSKYSVVYVPVCTVD